MIIDSHVHMGKSAWGDFSPAYLMNIITESVDFAICSNLEGIDSPEFKNELETNLEMLKIAKAFPKLKPLYVHPWQALNIYRKDQQVRQKPPKNRTDLQNNPYSTSHTYSIYYINKVCSCK